ncbi:MAG: hypothetical protein O3A00_27495 [Planctomycetota bacterium]|nr:hypothetical protein [Planctomycetota bacterium]
MNRGGSWNNNARNCRSANRNRNSPDNRNNNLGFRVAAVRWEVPGWGKADATSELEHRPDSCPVRFAGWQSSGLCR